MSHHRCRIRHQVASQHRLDDSHQGNLARSRIVDAKTKTITGSGVTLGARWRMDKPEDLSTASCCQTFCRAIRKSISNARPTQRIAALAPDPDTDMAPPMTSHQPKGMSTVRGSGAPTTHRVTCTESEAQFTALFTNLRRALVLDRA